MIPNTSSPIEFVCPYCRVWVDAEYCPAHYEFTHQQHGVTFEGLKARTAVLGGIQYREKSAQSTGW